MCIISFNYKSHSKYPLIIAANRDEFYNRPALPLHKWVDKDIIAGRDTLQGGTWMGVSPNKRFAAITNYRDPKLAENGSLSRGQIAVDFLEKDQSSRAYVHALQQRRSLYGPFNVLLFDGNELVHYNNIYDVITIVEPGIHGLSNDTLNTPWPKVRQLTHQVEMITSCDQFDTNDLFTALQHAEHAPDALLPTTGVPYELEKQLSSIFICLNGYGTRCSTVLLFDGQHFHIHEKTFNEGQFVTEQQCTL